MLVDIALSRAQTGQNRKSRQGVKRNQRRAITEEIAGFSNGQGGAEQFGFRTLLPRRAGVMRKNVF